jgi:small-conductance mechanosensitive channel
MRNLLPNPYLLALGVGLLAYIIIWLIKLALTTRVARFFGHKKNKWDDVVVFTLEKTTTFFMVAMAAYLGFRFVPHSKLIGSYANKLFFIFLMWQIAIWSHHLLEMWIHASIKRRTRTNPAVANSISLIKLLGRFILFSVIFLFTLSNLGIKITTIVAGLGVGGIAVALALQRILGDLFSSLSIVLDRPFMVGDFIEVGTYLGEVEKIGLKTTRLRSISGEQLIFSNSDLLSARIRNYRRMQERRIDFPLNLPLHLNMERLKTAISLIAAIIRSKKRARFERCHLKKIGQHFLEIETVFWVLSDEYDVYMDIQQDILFEIKAAFESENITFAYPTQRMEVLPTEVTVKNEHSAPHSPSGSVDSIVS